MNDDTVVVILVMVMFVIGAIVSAFILDRAWEKACLENNVAHYEITNGTEKVWVWNTALAGKETP